ncbi:hypothetical protein LIER_40146 [Lithospermum erythrorhizon]|uniref:PDZ domain-containing protein n=1 Tax=Lithospermum erythrorhizon TaxID=34254 RepID=A0AAV3QUB3_LITER
MIRCSSLDRESGEDDESSKLNPWKRRKEEPRYCLVFISQTVNASQQRFSNEGLSVYTKRAAFRVSPSVVSLISYSAGKQAFWCSGVIFSCFWNTDSFSYYVLTSATLLTPPASHGCDNDVRKFHSRNRGLDPDPPDRHCLPIDEKIDVYLKGGKLCEGTILTYDHHYNFAVLTFKLDKRLPCAVFRALDDSPTSVQASANRFPYPPAKLIPGDAVIAVGRYTVEPFEIMAAPGKYSAGFFKKNVELNCMELFWADCKITKCGIGGPIISCTGEVIGISFYAEHGTPFLPINIFLKWWSHCKVTMSHCRPSLGMKVANLHTAYPGTLDQLQKLGISQGLIVEKVLSGSPAEICGLCPGDVVIKCCDSIVVTPLQVYYSIYVINIFVLIVMVNSFQLIFFLTSAAYYIGYIPVRFQFVDMLDTKQYAEDSANMTYNSLFE